MEKKLEMEKKVILKTTGVRDWSKSIGGGGGGGPTQKGGGSSVFEPLIRGGSCIF